MRIDWVNDMNTGMLSSFARNKVVIDGKTYFTALNQMQKESFDEEHRLFEILSNIMHKKKNNKYPQYLYDILNSSYMFNDVKDWAVGFAPMSKIMTKKDANKIDIVSDEIAVVFTRENFTFWLPVRKNEFIRCYCQKEES